MRDSLQYELHSITPFQLRIVTLAIPVVIQCQLWHYQTLEIFLNSDLIQILNISKTFLFWQPEVSRPHSETPGV